MTGADILVKCLEMEGVECLFGYPGVAIAPFYDSILDSDINSILVRHEQHAVHNANGYARVTGKVGVAALTSGPGALNGITGIATAVADSIPVVVITGQVDSQLLGSDVFQEADICGACESFVKYSYLVRDPQDIPRIVKEAFYIANSGRKGPVLIDVPVDVQLATVNKVNYPEEVQLRTYKPSVKGNGMQIMRMVKEIRKAKRPILCVGGGVRPSHAEGEVRTFVQKNRIPTVSTMMGISSMQTDDPIYFGMVGNNGRKYGNQLMNEADTIIMVGARVADRSISQPSLITEGKVLIHIDVDPAEIGKNAGPTVPIVGDIKTIFEELNKEELQLDHAEWIAHLNETRAKFDARTQALMGNSNEKSVTPFRFVRMLSQMMDDDAIYTADVGQNQLWSCIGYYMKNGKFLTSGGMGTMGYALPAAAGAKVADLSRQVVAVMGDGAFQMSMMELATIMQYKIPLKIVVVKNTVLGLVKQYQHFSCKDRFSMIDLGTLPDLKCIAEAYGIRYLRLANDLEAEQVIGEFLQGNDTVLLEVNVDPAEVTL